MGKNSFYFDMDWGGYPIKFLNLGWNGFGSSFMGWAGIGAENLTREGLYWRVKSRYFCDNKIHQEFYDTVH